MEGGPGGGPVLVAVPVGAVLVEAVPVDTVPVVAVPVGVPGWRPTFSTNFSLS